jgi:hypothetical protein
VRAFFSAIALSPNSEAVAKDKLPCNPKPWPSLFPSLDALKLQMMGFLVLGGELLQPAKKVAINRL